MSKPSKKYLNYFKKYIENPEINWFTLFNDLDEYKKFLYTATPHYHDLLNFCVYVDCPWCQGDLR